jgi:hypothetical protein
MIRYIIAANEEEELPESDVTRFMRAFEGGFERGMAFTLYMPNATRVLLYVAEEGANSSAGPRAEFNSQCEAIKKPLVEIAGFIHELAQENYVKTVARRGTTEFPKDYGAHWRRYEAFFMDELLLLRFVCSVELTPKFKLYNLAKSL